MRSYVKKLIRIQTGIAPHWVGNGFPVRTQFSLRRVLACLLLASGVGLLIQQPAAALGTQAAQSSSDPPAYKPLRYEEDYSYLKDPRRRTDFWDPLKYIPLGSREGWYLSLGGEIRERYEFFHNEEAGGQPAGRHGNNGYAIHRYLLHGDLHLNLQDPAGPQNFIHVHPVLDLHFGEKVTVTTDWAFFWRVSLKDGIYRLSGSLLRTGRLSRERYVGSTPALTVTWTMTRHITMVASYVHFFAGPFFKETPPGKDIDYFTTWITYKF